jgi:hypothetical protein
VLALRYEQLIAEPEGVLRTVATFLGVHWEPALLNHHGLDHSELDAHGKAVGGTDPKRAIDRASVGRWRKVLPQSAVDSILDVAGDLNSQFYRSVI